MSINIKQKNEKEIIALDTFEAVRLRPTMYVGQVSGLDEKLALIKDKQIQSVEKTWSPGFMHMLVEILENSIDEAKRMKGKMKEIKVHISFDTNAITVTDTGGGFYKAASRHSKTKKSVVRTAFEEMHAGSNFVDNEKNILGTHGVGGAVVNILSKKFRVQTVNKTHKVTVDWEDFKLVNEQKAKRGTEPLGTSITFTPSTAVFGRMKWDIELLQTYLSYKMFILSLDSKLSKMKLNVTYTKDKKTQSLPLMTDFIPKEHVRVDSKDLGTIFMWEAKPNSTSLSFVNGSQCTGTHQRIVNDWANEYFGYNLAHHFYETLIVLDVPSNLMRFADQNKTKYAASRTEIEGKMKYAFHSALIRKLKGSPLSKKIEQRVEDKLFDENIKKIKKEKKVAKRKISEKYSPASKRKINLYITEGLSAAGSVKQARDSTTDGVYALKGKIKNTRHLRDLAENAEILEIMSILDLEPGKDNSPMYENIIIATDADADGHHIAALIINFFWRWFPHVIRKGKLFKLITPLVAADHGRNRKYFYTTSEFDQYQTKYKLSNITYLKGLGSLALNDWEYVMSNKALYQVNEDKEAEKYLEIAFGVSSAPRKLWLQGVV